MSNKGDVRWMFFSSTKCSNFIRNFWQFRGLWRAMIDIDYNALQESLEMEIWCNTLVSSVL